MGILTISLNHKVGWAIHHKDKCKKINSGRYTFQEIEGENNQKMFDRFESYIKGLLYSHGEVNEIFLLNDVFVDGDFYREGLNCLEKICEDLKVNLQILNLESIIQKIWGLKDIDEQKIITNVKTLGHMPDSIAEAYAISAIYHVNKI